MIAEQLAPHSPRQILMSGASRAPIDRAHSAGIRAVAYHFTRSLTDWARVPVLPSATLWEAAVVVSLLNQQASFEPERSTADTEAAFTRSHP
jgi:hypothetical protein